jgi:hypothetical protein
VHLERVTVTDLLHELEACRPDAQVRRAQPAWPFADAVVDPAMHQRGRPRPGARLGDLPEPARHQLGA